MKLKKGIPKAEIGRANKILENTLNNNNNISKVVDAVYAMARTIEERKTLKINEMRKKKEQNLKKQEDSENGEKD